MGKKGENKLFMALGFFMLFILVTMSFSSVSAAAADEEESGFFSKFWGFFKGLFGSGERAVSDLESKDDDSKSDDGDTRVSSGGSNVDLTLYGPTEASVNELITYTGGVVGSDTCTLAGKSLNDCSLFAEPLTFSVAGTYPITLAAAGEMETIVLVVSEESVVDNETEEDPVNETEEDPVNETEGDPVSEPVELSLVGPTGVVVGDMVLYTGWVAGADSCTLFGRSLDDCSSFAESFTFSLAGVYPITLAAGGNTKTIILFVEEDDEEDDGTGSCDAACVAAKCADGFCIWGDDCTISGAASTCTSTLNWLPKSASVHVGVDMPTADIHINPWYEGTEADKTISTTRPTQYVYTLYDGGIPVDSVTLQGHCQGPEYIINDIGNGCVSVDGTTDPGSQVTPVDTTTDINAVPYDDGTVDANGWPSYLNVPSYCAARSSDNTYTFDWPRYLGGSGAPVAGPSVPTGMFVVANAVRDTTMGTYTWAIFGKTEIMVMPFYSGNAASWNIKWKSASGTSSLRRSVSECPGDFSNVVYDDQIKHTGMRLDPGVRYFLNVRWVGGSCMDRPELDDCARQNSLDTSFKNNEEETYPPYSGPCLDEPPFPPNYLEHECRYREEGKSYGSCGSYGREVLPYKETTWVCTDGPNGALLAEYVWECNYGLYKITKGANIPATPNMVCTRSGGLL